MPHEFQADLDAIARIDAIPTILDVVCQTTGMGFAAVARVTEERWIMCSVLDNLNFGLQPGGELKVETTICHEVRDRREPVVINNVAESEVYRGHPTPAMYDFQSYISMPIILRDGSFFGTLCALDPRPARLENPATIGMFKLFAELIGAHLYSDQQLAFAQSALTEERKLSDLREQFIAVLGHDLRNPVAAVDSGAKLLLRTVSGEKERRILSLMQGSILRMRGLIDNVLDFARARLGGGVTLDIASDRPLQPVLEQVVSEFRTIHPARIIEARFELFERVECDHVRIAQLFSNLLGNALTHGAEQKAITVHALTKGCVFSLDVSNEGAPIPADTIKNLFQPFFRGKSRSTQEGLGLGLYIASEIANAHGGTLEVSSLDHETKFSFKMACLRSQPRQAATSDERLAAFSD